MENNNLKNQQQKRNGELNDGLRINPDVEWIEKLIEINCDGLSEQEANTVLYRFLKEIRNLENAKELFDKYRVTLKGVDFD
jgi:hypothetical protein